MAELTTIARPYAEALFQVARKGDVAAWGRQIEALSQELARLKTQVEASTAMPMSPGTAASFTASHCASRAVPYRHTFLPIATKRDVRDPGYDRGPASPGLA